MTEIWRELTERSIERNDTFRRYRAGCPYTRYCEEYRVMKKMGSSTYEGGTSVIGDRCENHPGRCLRYWQFKKRNEETIMLLKAVKDEG